MLVPDSLVHVTPIAVSSESDLLYIVIIIVIAPTISNAP